MDIKIVYPARKKRKIQRDQIIKWAKWPIAAAVFACPVVNICVGGPAWSAVALFSIWIIWSLGISPDLVEYNRISQVIKLIVNASILLILIDVLLAPGWAADVVPIVCFGGLSAAGALFFTDIDRQKQNAMPLFALIIVSMVVSAAWIILWRDEVRWTVIVMGALAFAMLVACVAILGGGFFREIKKRFHTA